MIAKGFVRAVILVLTWPVLTRGELVSELQGLSWGGPREAAKERLVKIPGLTLKPSDSDSLVFLGGSWPDFPVEWGTLEFKGDRLWHAVVYVTYYDAGAVVP